MEQVYQHRQELVKEQMRQKGMAKALFTETFSIFYLTGAFIVPYERFLGFVLDVDKKEGTLIMPLFEKGHLKDGCSLEAPYEDTENPLSLAAELLGASGNVGVEKQHFPLAKAEKLNTIGQYTWLNVEDILLQMRLHKDAAEIQQMQKACKLTGDLYAAMREKIVPGKTENQLRGDILLFISQNPELLGPSSAVQVSSGIHSSIAHGMSGDRSFQAGESVIIDVGVNYGHYLSDLTRTFFVGEPDARYQEIYKVVQEASAAAMAVVKPGRAIGEVDQAARHVIEKAGYGAYFTHRVGHGLGLDIHEDPSVHGLNTELLTEGMVFTIEPGIYLPGIGGVRLEDNVVVTADGYCALSDYPKSLANAIVK